jgi:tRNA(fMet)-specific endonuclease VapC
MALIFDTNALSAFADGDADLRSAMAAEDEVALPSIVLGEYLFGVRQSRYRARYESWLQQFVNLFTILQVGVNTAGHYAEIRSELKTAGHPIPTNDLWIAAIAREHHYRLATRDTHFRLVRGIRVLSW